MKTISYYVFTFILFGILSFEGYAQPTQSFPKIQENTSEKIGSSHPKSVMEFRKKVPINKDQSHARPMESKSRLKTMTYQEYENDELLWEEHSVLYWANGMSAENLGEETTDDLEFYPGYSIYFSKPELPILYDSLHVYDSTTEDFYDFRVTAEKGPDGRIVAHYYQDLEGDIWIDAYRYEYEYNDEGLISSSKYSYPHEGSWIEADVNEFQYDDQGRLSQETITFDIEENPTPDIRFTYEYDNDDNLVKQFLERWDEEKDDWSFFRRFTAFYGENEILSETSDVYIPSTGKYETESEVVYLYSSEGNFRLDFYEYDGGTSELVRIMDYTHDGDNVSEVHVFKVKDNDLIPEEKLLYTHNSYDQVTSFEYYYWEGDEWDWGEEKLQFTYEEYDDTTDAENPESSQDQVELTLYPNPTEDFLTVTVTDDHIDKVRIMDMQGHQVFASANDLKTSEITLPVHQLSSGTYLVEIYAGQKKGVQKVIVK